MTTAAEKKIDMLLVNEASRLKKQGLSDAEIYDALLKKLDAMGKGKTGKTADIINVARISLTFSQWHERLR